MEARLRREGRTELRNVHLVHTNEGEELAVRTIAELARHAGAALYVAHVCHGEPALDTIAARRAAGQPVYGEVLHNNLCFSLDDYDKPDGAKYHIGMGLRPRRDGQALWLGLADGRLSTLATDEYTTSLAVKLAGRDIETTPGGHVGIETRGMIGLAEGVDAGRMTLRRFVEVFATNPARVTGLYPRKGVIAPGSDADVGLWDARAGGTLRLEDLHHDGDYSPWERVARDGAPGHGAAARAGRGRERPAARLARRRALRAAPPGRRRAGGRGVLIQAGRSSPRAVRTAACIAARSGSSSCHQRRPTTACSTSMPSPSSGRAPAAAASRRKRVPGVMTTSAATSPAGADDQSTAGASSASSWPADVALTSTATSCEMA